MIAMLRTIVFSAAAAGLLVGLAATAIQAFTTTPLILAAEVYEVGGHSHDIAVALPGEGAAVAAEAHDDGAEEWAPADGVERFVYTGLANVVLGVALSAILLGLMIARGGTISVRDGLLWGIGGFVAGSLLPALGLPPELPGTPAADIFARQTWWLATIAASGIGLSAIVFGRDWFWRVGGIVLLVVPHIFGAPMPPNLETAYPAGLLGEFVAASLAVSAFVWAMSGLAVAWTYERLARMEARADAPPRPQGSPAR